MSLILSLVLLSLPFWDVLEIGYQADRLCSEQGGLHVYKTVEAEGFVGASSIKYWAKYGFKYVEGGGTRGRKFRATIKDGKVRDVEVPKYISRYEFTQIENHKVVNSHMTRLRYQVIDRQTGEVLGELVYFAILPGRFDRFFLGVLPVEFNPWICGREAPPGKGEYWPARGIWVYGSGELIRATIKPQH